MMQIKPVIGAVAAALISSSALAGNGDRVGSAGATQLLINPWARSSAWANVGVACDVGLDAVFTNIAGLAFTKRTQVRFDHTRWFSDAGIAINTGGIAQRLGEKSALSIAVMSMGSGDIERTTDGQPEGTGTFSAVLSNFNVGYAQEFTNSIYGGVNFKVVNEGIANLRATTVAFDAGIRYVTGEKERVKFGITLKNIGPTMSYKGDGLEIQAMYGESKKLATLQQRSSSFEIPSALNIGGSYDFNFDSSGTQKLTAALAFSANSFSNDQYRIGLNYEMNLGKSAFNVMMGYTFEEGLWSKEGFAYMERVTVRGGLSAGLSVDAVLGKNKNRLGIQYAYRHTALFSGIHTVGFSIDLR